MEYNRSYLEYLALWVKYNSERLERLGCKLELSDIYNSDKSSRVLEIDSGADLIGTFSLWESGENDIEILGIESDENDVTTHTVISNLAELDLELEKFEEDMLIVKKIKNKFKKY